MPSVLRETIAYAIRIEVTGQIDEAAFRDTKMCIELGCYLVTKCSFLPEVIIGFFFSFLLSFSFHINVELRLFLS